MVLLPVVIQENAPTLNAIICDFSRHYRMQPVGEIVFRGLDCKNIPHSPALEYQEQKSPAPRRSSSPPPVFSPLHKNTSSAILRASQVVPFYDLLHPPNENMTFISFITYLLQSTTTHLKQQISHLITLLSFLHVTFHITQNQQQYITTYMFNHTLIWNKSLPDIIIYSDATVLMMIAPPPTPQNFIQHLPPDQ